MLIILVAIVYPTALTFLYFEGLIPKSGDSACTVGYHNERP
jgi:hypothetical protein